MFTYFKGGTSKVFSLWFHPQKKLVYLKGFFFENGIKLKILSEIQPSLLTSVNIYLYFLIFYHFIDF